MSWVIILCILYWGLIHLKTRFISCLVFYHFVLMKGLRALIKYVVFNFVFRSSVKQDATYKYLFIISLNNCELELIHIALWLVRLECKYYDYAMKRKNQNKCYRAHAVTLIIVFKNIYQIFRPITLLKHMLNNQYVQQIIV